MKKAMSMILMGAMIIATLAGCAGQAPGSTGGSSVAQASGGDAALWYSPIVTEEAAKAEKLIEGKRKILIVIDMQNDFIDGALGTPEAQAMLPACIEKIKSYDPKDVYATMDTHFEDNYMDTWEGKNLPVLHCIKDTEGWQLQSEIDELIPQDHRFIKYTFGSLDLQQFIIDLASKEDIELEFVGLCTDICVVSNAMLCKAAVPSMSITVDAAACAGVTPETHDAALTTMATCQMVVINNE